MNRSNLGIFLSIFFSLLKWASIITVTVLYVLLNVSALALELSEEVLDILDGSEL